MIPDEPFNFNHYCALSNLGAHEARLRHLFQQGPMPTLEGSRHLLYVCPICKRPWYKGARQEYPRLTPEQLAYLGAALHTDVHALHLLPRALCPICSTVHLGGMFSFGEYPHHKGYHFLWESASPRRIRLLAMVCRSEGLTLDLLVQMSPETRVEPVCDIRAARRRSKRIQMSTASILPSVVLQGAHPMAVYTCGVGMSGRRTAIRLEAMCWSRWRSLSTRLLHPRLSACS
jgi:hypothetical protein